MNIPSERRGIHSQIGENGADRAVYIDPEDFFSRGKCFLNLRAPPACARRPRHLARKFEQRAVRGSLVCTR